MKMKMEIGCLLEKFLGGMLLLKAQVLFITVVKIIITTMTRNKILTTIISMTNEQKTDKGMYLEACSLKEMTEI